MRKLKRLLCLFSAFLLCLFTVLPTEAADELTLYARWQVQITFDANGGTLSGGITEEERALAGQQRGSITYNTGQAFSTGLTATRTNYALRWFNTASDGSGMWMSDYETVDGPETFYAIWVQAVMNYGYTGGYQYYTVPYDGIYQITCTGATGAHGYYSGSDGTVYAVNHGQGATVSGQIQLSAGTRLCIAVGEHGYQSYRTVRGGWNGGGSANGGTIAATSGGGATDIRINDNNVSNRIMVAGGGGGSSQYAGGYGAAGGALTGPRGGNNGGMGGTQTSGGANGVGTSGYSGGGGGYWGGYGSSTASGGGGGGSSYISGYAGCLAHESGYTFSNCVMTQGASYWPNSHGSARIQLIAFVEQ